MAPNVTSYELEYTRGRKNTRPMFAQPPEKAQRRWSSLPVTCVYKRLFIFAQNQRVSSRNPLKEAPHRGKFGAGTRAAQRKTAILILYLYVVQVIIHVYT